MDCAVTKPILLPRALAARKFVPAAGMLIKGN